MKHFYPTEEDMESLFEENEQRKERVRARRRKFKDYDRNYEDDEYEKDRNYEYDEKR